MHRSFRVSSPRVMHETIEGEVIVIDLTTGSYYSLRGSGAAVWEAIERGSSEGEIVRALGERYDAPAAEIASAVGRLLGELEAQGLVEGADDGAPAAATETSQSGVDGPRPAFQAPVLEKHTDMQDLILLDPVHEVDERGWPHAAPAGSERP